MAYRLDLLSVDDPDAGRVTVRGDGFAAAGEIATLLVSPEVQRYLEMTPDEVAQASAITDEYREALKRLYQGGTWTPPSLDPAARRAREALSDAIAKLLGGDRTQRLKRLSWRIRGGDALLDDDVVEALQLSADQRRRVADVAAANENDHARVLRELSAVRLRDSAALQDRGSRAHDAGSARLLALLTPEQRQVFTRLQKGSE